MLPRLHCIGFYFLMLTAFHTNAQIVINEVSSASVSTYLDEDGDQEDWIEFYNPTASPINMAGYTISSIENGKTKSWIFPSINIKANDYLTVFCSKKNRSAYFDHWEVPVYPQLPWKYFLGTANPPTNWPDITFNDASWLTGIGGIGYGDGDDSTVTPPITSIFMRTSFNVADTSKIPTALLFLDYDDGFVAYLNGVEIARANIGIYGDRPNFNTWAYDEHEATVYSTGNFSGAYFVSPAVVDAAIKPGVNVFSIQVHNFSSGTDDLSMIPYFLIGVNDTAVTYFPFAATVNLHTSFNLNSTGQELILTDATGGFVDQYAIGDMQLNNTFGRRPNGASSWYYFDAPTPDTTNNTSAFYTNYLSKPSFSLGAGFYNSTQTLSMTSSTGLIRYTLDGKDPDQTCALYSTPITIDSTMVVRARTYSTDPLELPSEIITNTYFINENIELPVVSLTSDPYNLFDFYYGIYVMGPNADTVNVPFQGANFWQGWERPANIEYFDPNGNLGFETPSSIAIQGNYSKAWPQRGFAVKTKENYKGETIDYPLFPDKSHITQYKSFNIRNAGSDWNKAHMRDRFNQKNAQKSTSLDIMDGRPCVLFVNGSYFGVYELREKQDKDYIENNSGVPAENIDFLQFDGDIIEGSNAAFLNMSAWIGSNDMSIPANYNTAKSMLDIENFCDYFITETYVLNIDWLGSYTNNIKFWRPNNPVGKWRYVLWDTDLSLGFASAWGGAASTDFLDVAINPITSNPHSTMLSGLLANTEFKNYFVDRYADLMNTIFLPSTMQQNADALHDEMLPEMSRHFNRWGGSFWGGLIGPSDNVTEWENEIDTMMLFASTRIGFARDQIQSQFGLTKQVDVTLDVMPAGAGTIKISTITPESLPWTGVYFDGVPVTITAIANPGYEFKYWEANSNLSINDSLSSITLNIDTTDVFKAHFEMLELGLDVYPNPFNNNITINFQLPKSMQASLKLYSIMGQEVATIISPNTFHEEGSYSFTFNTDGLDMAQGMYFIELKTQEFTKTIKLIKAKTL
ncbi:MAG TPA: CotH kinase family protein [Bacteroidia bacterium]|nr:CotH kinase family protein [Bacteroidia bacterium]